MEINFQCKKCSQVFDCEVGKISMNTTTFSAEFEKDVECPNCGILAIDKVLLTEYGQSQMTEAMI